MKDKLYYLAHPVGPDDVHTYEENIADGEDWWRALLRAGYNVDAPWLGLCHTLDDFDSADRKIGMEIDKKVLERLDGIILTGHTVSSGMKAELDLATEKDLPVFVLVDMPIDTGVRSLGHLMEALESDCE